MYSNDREIIQYVMNAIDEGASVHEIRQEISRIADAGSLIDPVSEPLKECITYEGGRYETL